MPQATGQRDIRSIWPKYYADCHAVVFVIDSTDKERIEECWAVFGEYNSFPHLCLFRRLTDRVLVQMQKLSLRIIE